MDTRHLGFLQTRVAEVAIGASTLRNQGARGVVQSTREFLKRLDLRLFRVDNPQAYRARLEQATAELRMSLPGGTRHWGTARKALNIFLRNVLYHHYLRDECGFGRLEAWLEVPLDSNVANGLQREPRGDLPARWPSVKHLSLDVSNEYQGFAEHVAKHHGLVRVHLDLLYWRRNTSEGRRKAAGAKGVVPRGTTV